VLRQSAFFAGRPIELADIDGSGVTKDIAWFHPTGQEMATRDWHDSALRTLGMYLDGRGIRHRGRRGQAIVDASFLLLLHSGDDGIDFRLPGRPWAHSYTPVIDTAEPAGVPPPATFEGGAALSMLARSVRLLRVERT
jgi:glycogen operon protein